jgi:hypothetical protein
MTVDGCSGQTQVFETHNGTYTLLLFSTIILFTGKGIYPNQDSVGFEPETSVHFRIEPEKSVTELSHHH